ncbi:hypothetical protein [Clostridium cibarium]|uniref:Lipoprotein n=1 Tax=Clostridium cibarium TaxID=2762247 RepID=A0ABR8PVU2_9CLOT|nr:hypothetical protein [Clostridium cibarium]MBD7912265.1 hypothetical protein [Clostridium cibarium]
MKNKKLFMFPLILGLVIFQLIGCSYKTTVNGVDKSNSTKVSKVEFVNGYESNYKNEETVSSYQNTNGLYGRVYFENVPDDATKILFVWKDKNGDKTVTSAELDITSAQSKEPAKSYVTSNGGVVPNGTYVLETYLKDTNDLLNKSEIQVSNK